MSLAQEQTRADLTSKQVNFAQTMRPSVRDLLRPHPLIFWSDLLLCTVVAYGALWIHLTWPADSLVQVVAFITTMSYLRALSSHRYFNDGRELSYLDQMFDSTTIPGNPILTELWAPLGQRNHALHHVFPSIPYHSLGVAHRRLMRELPSSAPYRRTIRRSLIDALRSVWRQSGELDPGDRSTSGDK